MTTVSLLPLDNKNIKEIQKIDISTKAANMAKHSNNMPNYKVDHINKKKIRQLPTIVIQRTNKKCFNCKKIRYYTKDYFSNLKKKPKDKKAVEEVKYNY